MKTYIVKLEDHDDVISTRDKISWSKARRVLLVWPRHGRILERQLDLRLIQRHCQQLGAQLAIITGSGQVKSYAAELGIPVFRNPIQAQQAAWRRLPGAQAGLKIDPAQSGSRSSARVLREQQKLHRVDATEKNWLRYTAFSIGFLAFLALAFFFVPGARIIIAPVQKPQQITLPVFLQPGISNANPTGMIPAYPVTVIVEGRDQVTATFSITVPDQTARGEVLFTNLTEQPVEIPQGSVVLTTGTQPIRYVTTQAVVIPAGVGAVRLAAVQAVSAGSGWNIPSGRLQALEGPLGLQVSVTNPKAISGGSNRTSPAPGLLDYQNLKQKMLVDLEKIGLDEMRSKMLASQRLIEESIWVQSVVTEEREPRENQPADVLQLTLQVEFQAMFIEEKDLRLVALSALDANLESGFHPLPDSLFFQIELDPVQGDRQDIVETGLRGELSAERTLKANLNQDEMILSVRGRRMAEAVRMMESDLNLAVSPIVEITPSWWRIMPFLPFRITVVEQ